MNMILTKCSFQNGFPSFLSTICCWYMLGLPHRGNTNMYPQHMFNGLEILHYKLFFNYLYCFSEISMVN